MRLYDTVYFQTVFLFQHQVLFYACSQPGRSVIMLVNGRRATYWITEC